MPTTRYNQLVALFTPIVAVHQNCSVVELIDDVTERFANNETFEEFAKSLHAAGYSKAETMTAWTILKEHE